VTGRRLAAARRFLQKENDKVALFPELQIDQSPEERVLETNLVAESWLKDHRKWMAGKWREARAKLRGLPRDQRDLILAYWQKRIFPGCPTYLIGLISDEVSGRHSIAAQNAIVERCRQIGEAWRRNQPAAIAQS